MCTSRITIHSVITTSILMLKIVVEELKTVAFGILFRRNQEFGEVRPPNENHQIRPNMTMQPMEKKLRMYPRMMTRSKQV